MDASACASNDGRCLPADILTMIFSRLALRPRLGVVALVCRHWRACALRSVTQVGDGAPAYLAALPSLTMLHASSETLRCDPSPSLRILSYNSRGAALGGCSCHHLRGLSRLTRLTLDTDLGAGCCTEAHALIARNADTLEKLALAMGPQTPSAASSALLSSPRLPRLCALQVTLVPDAVSLVQTHASQLTRLTVEFSSADHSTALTLPMCRSLKIVGAIAPAALNWALPALTSIKCNLFTGPPGDLPLEALRTLLMHQFTANRAVGQLSRCTGLRDLTFWGTPSGLPLNDLPPLPALHTLSMYHCSGDSKHYREFFAHLQCSALTSLKIDHQLARELLAAWPFPRLRKLTLVGPHDASDVLPYLDAAPHLTRLHMCITGGISDELLPLLGNKGLEKVSVDVYTYDDYSDLKAALRAPPNLWKEFEVTVIEP